MIVTLHAVERAEYTRLFAVAPRSNLLQDWSWGDGKAAAEGWRPVRLRMAVDNETVAVAQFLERRFGPLAGLRLNRGPVWLQPDLSIEIKMAVIAALRRRWRWWRGRILLMAPELPAEASKMLVATGFRRRSAPAWQSSWLDLRRPPQEIRKALAGKWRNMLVKAEKSGGTVDMLKGSEAVAWLLPHYREMIQRMGFSGVPEPMLTALAQHGDVIAFRFWANGEAVSCVLVARHGSSATYLVSWNSEDGRRLSGNYLLLWSAVMALQDSGCHWFDLGGIDAQLTPGVAAFKRGLGGEEYILAGEWLSL